MTVASRSHEMNIVTPSPVKAGGLQISVPPNLPVPVRVGTPTTVGRAKSDS